MKTLLVVLVTFAFSACAATVGSLATVPKDSPATCTKFCSEMGLTLSSVVIMANNVGCVCNAASTGTADAQGAAVAGGAAAVLMQEEAHRQQSSNPAGAPKPGK